MKRTKVFYQIRKAIHARNEDGSRKYRYILLSGSSRSSKTTSTIQNFYSEAWNETSKRFSVWRNEKKICKDTVGHDMKNIFPTMPYYSPSVVSFHKTESVYTFPSGSTIEICGTDDAEKVHGYNGDVLWLNEPYSISKDTFDQLDQRTNDYVIVDMNPKMAHWADDLKKDPRCLVLHSTFRDNAYCPPEQKIKILGYQPVKMCSVVTEKILTESEAKAYNLSENTLNLSEKLLKELSRCKENERKASADAYKWSVYGLGLHAEKPNRIFFWEEISLDDYNKLEAVKYYGVDWGVVDPWGIIEAKYYDGALYLHELNYASENEIKSELTMKELEQVNNGEDEEKREKGLVKWLFKKLNIAKNAIIVCDNNRPVKIQALWDMGFDNATAAPKPPGSIIDGITMLSNLKCYYTHTSTNLKYEQENYEREVDKYGEVQEEPVDTNNHCMDPARYIALYLTLMGIIKA
jgi:phage terminase large subunit